MRTGTRPHHEEECVLDLAVEPDDACQPAEHFALATFAADRFGHNRGTIGASLYVRVHAVLPDVEEAIDRAIRSSRRAARSFNMNCVALMK